MEKAESDSIDWTALRKSVYRFLRSRSPNREIAEDLTHDSLIKVSKSLGRVKEPEKLIAWSISIARNVSNDYYRRRKNDVSETEADESLIIERSNLNERIASWLPQAINELSPSDRDLVERIEIGGQSIKTAAHELGITYTAAKSRVQRARKKLRDALLDCCRLEFDPRGNIIDYTPRQVECDC